MATYYPTSNNQTDATPMHYLRESLPTSYSEAPIISGNTMMYMNYSSSSGPCTGTIGENSQQLNNCNETIVSDFGGSRFGERDFNGWGRDINEMPFMQLMGGATSVLQGVHHLQGQGLSLSLSTQIPSTLQLPSVEYQIPNSGFASFLSPNMSIQGEGSGRSVSVGGNSDSMKMDISSYGMLSNIERTIPNSKYLKAVQQLLDEVVNARIALKRQDCKNDMMTGSKEVDGELKNETKLPPSSGVSSNPQESISNSPSELSAAERQDLQNKLMKLLSMLDEIDKRYKKYYHQMQIVVSSFDVIAGRDAAKPYTALALETISRHFRCLRDAINSQIRITRRGLGDQDASENSKGVGISRLRYVDQQLRQQKAFQQFGLMQQHAWRPQRGLPENSVSILRAWLFEHFLHPYPKDSEKIILARQTGLTKSQISNWFINARVRLWKPMVEDMYKEEIDDADVDSNSSEAPPKATKSDTRTSEDKAEEFHQSATSKATDQSSTDATFHSGIQRGIETKYQYGVVKSREEQRPGVDVFPDAIVQSDGGSGRLMETAAYNRSELGRFGNESSVSLTLGLQHCEGVEIPMSVETHHSFITMRGDDIYNAASSSMGPTADFDYLDSGNLQRRFGSSHLLHDFVA